MKITDPLPFVLFSEDSSLSVEVQQAQRMAELQQISEYRRLRLEEYKRWSAMSAEEREAHNTRMKEEAKLSRAHVAAQAQAYADWYDSEKVNISIKEVSKPPPPPPVAARPWWKRLFKWGGSG